MKHKLIENFYFILVFSLIAGVLMFLNQPSKPSFKRQGPMDFKVLYRAQSGSYELYYPELTRLVSDLSKERIICRLGYVKFLDQEMYTPVEDLRYLVGCVTESNPSTDLLRHLNLKRAEISMSDSLEFKVRNFFLKRFEIFQSAYEWSVGHSIPFAGVPHFLVELQDKLNMTIYFPIKQHERLQEDH